MFRNILLGQLTSGKKHLQHPNVALVRGNHQRRAPVLVRLLNGGAESQQQVHDLPFSRLDRTQQGRERLLVLGLRVSSPVQQPQDDVLAAVQAGRRQRRLPQQSVDGVQAEIIAPVLVALQQELTDLKQVGK